MEKGAQKKRKFGAKFKEVAVFSRGKNNIKKNGGQQSIPVDAPRKPTRKPNAAGLQLTNPVRDAFPQKWTNIPVSSMFGNRAK